MDFLGHFVLSDRNLTNTSHTQIFQSAFYMLSLGIVYKIFCDTNLRVKYLQSGCFIIEHRGLDWIFASVQGPGLKFCLFCPLNMSDTNSSPFTPCSYPGSDLHQPSIELLKVHAAQIASILLCIPLLLSLFSVVPVLSKFQLKPVPGTI